MACDTFYHAKKRAKISLTPKSVRRFLSHYIA
jgi:hypothetical protein